MWGPTWTTPRHAALRCAALCCAGLRWAVLLFALACCSGRQQPACAARRPCPAASQAWRAHTALRLPCSTLPSRQVRAKFSKSYYAMTDGFLVRGLCVMQRVCGWGAGGLRAPGCRLQRGLG